MIGKFAEYMEEFQIEWKIPSSTLLESLRIVGDDEIIFKSKYIIFVIKLNCLSGARVDIKNNENKTAYDLAKDPETAGLLQHAGN